MVVKLLPKQNQAEQSMTRIFGAVCALVALSACQPRIPDSAAGVFDEPTNVALPPANAVSQETIPEPPQVPAIEVQSAPQVAAAPLTTTAVATPAVSAPAPSVHSVPQTPSSVTQPASSDAAAIAAETTAALSAATANSGVLPLEASPSNPAPKVFSNPGISDENDFAAVDARRSIEADAALRAQNQANYTVITPTTVPQRSGAQGPNIVAFALATSHPRGTKVYNRLGLTSKARYQRACARFGSDEAAQQAFLERGGPKADRIGVDPDGDGYACDWDPAPFRNVVGN